MYNFTFSENKDKIIQDENIQKKYLIFIKRLLPRFLNGINDNDFLNLFNFSKQSKGNLVETGCGSSTIALFFSAYLNKSILYSWDTNLQKQEEIYRVLFQTFGKFLKVEIDRHLVQVNSSSTDPYLGILAFQEKNILPTFGFFDSYHSADNLKKEIEMFLKIRKKEMSIISIDDSYLNQKKIYLPFLNMQRQKLKLSKIKKIKNNKSLIFKNEIKKLLNQKKIKYSILENKKIISNNTFFSYFEDDRKYMSKNGMEVNRNKKFTIYKL